MSAVMSFSAATLAAKGMRLLTLKGVIRQWPAKCYADPAAHGEVCRRRCGGSHTGIEGAGQTTVRPLSLRPGQSTNEIEDNDE